MVFNSKANNCNSYANKGLYLTNNFKCFNKQNTFSYFKPLPRIAKGWMPVGVSVAVEEGGVIVS